MHISAYVPGYLFFVGSVQPPVSSFIFSVDMPYRVDMIVYLHLQIVKSHLRTSMNNKSGI